MNMISEGQLKNLLKHYLVFEFKSKGVDAMCIKEYLPLCAALLFPFINDIIIEDNKPNDTIIPIINSIKKFTKKLEGIQSYSLEGLRCFFRNKWLPTIDFNGQKKLLSNAVSLISAIENNGFFSIKGDEKIHDIYLNGKVTYPDVSENYGTEEYLEEENVHQVSFSNQHTTRKPTPPNNEKINKLEEFLFTNFPLNMFPKGLRQYDFFWKFKLNADQYKKLKEILLDMSLADNIRLLTKEICGYGTVALCVVLYISEWYKRECDSLDGDKCLESIGLGSKNSKQVWCNSGLPKEFLHQTDKKNQMRQMAMCALGGLPLKFVNNSDRFKQFVTRLFILNKREEETTEEDIESIIDCFDDNNGVFKHSLQSGSCKDYLISLVKYLETEKTCDLPFSDSELNIPPFSTFLKNLQDGYDKALPSNFLLKEIRIWTYDFMEEGDDSNTIESEFYVHIGFLNNNNVITTRELSKLGIVLPPEASMFDARLRITLKDGSNSITEEKRTYHKIGNHCDDFCGAFGSSLATSIDLFKTKYIALLIECGDYCKEIELYTIPSYLELYATDNGFLWTTKKNNAAQKVVFFDKSIYTLQNEDDLDVLTKSFDGSEWGWVYVTETINLVDSTRRLISIGLGKSKLIMVDFKVRNLRKAIELSKDGCVECVIKDEDIREIPLLYLDDKKRPMLSCDGMRGNDLLKNYKIEFKTTSDYYYSEWTTNQVPSQGFLSIRISCRDERKKKRSWRRDVYFIRGTYPIVKRNLDYNYIYIKGENVCVQDELLNNNLSPADGEFNYKYKDGCYDLDSSSISFQIGDEENHIVLKAYRAFNLTRILNYGKTIKDITNDGNEKPPVALILQKNIHLKVVNEEGYKDYSPCFQRYLNYFRDPRDLSLVKQGNSLSGFYIDDASRPYLYCVYIKSFDDNGKIRKIEKNKDKRGNEFILLNVSDDYINEYALCYWSGEPKDNPVRLELTQLGKRLYRFDIPSPLRGKAIIFQSLQNCSPNLYFRPFYADECWTWDNYVQRYDGVTIDYLIECFQLAVEHNVYFCVFPAIRNLQKKDEFSKFIRKYAQLKNFTFSRKDELNLTRLAKELSMDWYFTNNNILYDGDNNFNEKLEECMKRLMQNSPIYRAFIFGDFELRANVNLAMNNYNKKYNGCDNTNNRNDLLNQIITYTH